MAVIGKYMWRLKNRDQILDIGRFVAILFVMLFHFYSRWFDLYPYENHFDYFSYGYLGVEFFFILSGYLIFPSLDKSQNIASFWKKKLIRLWPTLIICSLLIFIVCGALDHDNIMPTWHNWRNLIASITFLSPDLLNKLGWDVSYINGSYWFLWVEIQFLLVTSIVYFLNRNHAKRNCLLMYSFAYFAIYCMQRIVANVQTTNKLGLTLSDGFIANFHEWFVILNLLRFSAFFLFGMALYIIQTEQDKKMKYAYVLVVLIQFVCELWRWSVNEQLWIGLIIILCAIYIFVCMMIGGIPESKWLMPLAKFWAGSYFVYCIHEPIGVMLINRLCVNPIVIVIGFYLLGVLYHKYIEIPISKQLSK